MSSITLNKERIANFTSSEIWKLMTNDRAGTGFGKPALTYIAEKQMEARLGRSLSTDRGGVETKWGKLNESRVFEKLDLTYYLCSNETKLHELIKHWSGSADCLKFDDTRTVVDIKCPFTLKSFCGIVDCVDIDQLRKEYDYGEKYYWQLVSNAILNGCNFAELICYVPYKSELPDIRLTAEFDNEYNFVKYSEDYALPYLIDGGFYKNINVLRFEILQAEKDLLTNRVIHAVEILNK